MSEFHCGCPVCAANWGLITGLEARIDRLSDALDKEQAICRILEERVAELIILQAALRAAQAALREIAAAAWRADHSDTQIRAIARRGLEAKP